MKRLMKVIFILFLLTCVLSIAKSQSTTLQFSQENNLSRYAKVWGLLKYYHPEIAKGNIDWDSVLVVNIASVKTADSKKKFISEIKKLLDVSGDLRVCDTCDFFNPDSIKRYPDFDWVRDTVYFSRPLIDKLEFIIENKTPFDNYYVQIDPDNGSTTYENEKAYKDMVYPSEEYRLLALFRYWNVINYFFPYKHLMDREWNEVLMEFIPEFVNTLDTIDYHLLVFELAAKIDDSHAISTSDLLNSYWGDKYLPFLTSYIESSTVVTEVFYQSDSLININVGDVIISRDNKLMSDIRHDWSLYISGSNEVSKQSLIDLFLFNTNCDTLHFDVIRGNQEHKLEVASLNSDEIRPIFYRKYMKRDVINWISNDIVYIKLSHLQRGDVDSLMQEVIKSTAIIFDLRGYPRNTMYQISEYLNPEKKYFTLIYSPDLDFPGLFRYTDMLETGPDNYNNDFYKGKIIILIDVNTQSHGEFTCMALQTAPNVTIIGSQTSGADGNVSQFKLPGNITVRFSGIGIAYPNGNETQRIGIIPDVFIESTIKGITDVEDEVLN
ncbi:MAG: S41 family peptidase [Bacteroidales bacterium]|nr:S41 family peptidase [Bacteroidales bacterium]